MSRDRKYDAPEFAPATSHVDWLIAQGEICDECGRPIDETDLAPSCGAHRLHLDCRGRFDCRWCDEEWEDANS